MELPVKNPLLMMALVVLPWMSTGGMASATPPDSPRVAAERFEALADEHRQLPIDELRRSLDPEFVSLIEGFSRDLDSLSDDEVRVYKSAAFTAAFYTKRPRYLYPQVAAFEVLEGRAAVIEDDVRNLQRGYVLARDFEQADALQRRYPSPGLQVIPTMEAAETGSTPNALILTPDRTLKPVEVDLASGDRLVALVHPHCAFSRQAMVDLTSDREAGLPWETLWVIPFAPNLAADAIHEWQQAHPDVRFHIPSRFDDWSFLQQGEHPVFYRINDGKAVGRVVGWPADGNLAALHQLFER